MTKPFRFPAKLGDCIDLGAKYRDERLAFQKEMEEKIAEMKAREKVIDEHILTLLEGQGLDKATGTDCSASISKQPIPTVKDWPKFYAFILKTKQFELLEKRPARAAYRERVESGVVIPGVETFWDKKIFYGNLKKER